MTSRLIFLVLMLLGHELVRGDDSADKRGQLAGLQPLVGSWRGVGQPQRGSTKDSWIETAAWAWSFDPAGPALVGQFSKGRYFRELRLAATAGGEFSLWAEPAVGGPPVEYAGRQENEQLVLTASQPQEGLPLRISFRFAAGGDRLLVLLERPSAGSDRLVRLAEIGYTRQGSGFGQLGQERECVVTGGLGTMEVTYGGKTYAVCCTGCRDYFNENAEKVLAEYAQRQAAKKK